VTKYKDPIFAIRFSSYILRLKKCNAILQPSVTLYTKTPEIPQKVQFIFISFPQTA